MSFNSKITSIIYYLYIYLNKISQITNPKNPTSPHPSTGGNSLTLSEHYYLLSLSISPTHSSTLSNLGKIYSDKAQSEAERLGRWDNVGNFFFKKGKTYYESAIKFEEGHLQSYINLGLLYHSFNLHSSSISVFNSALNKNLKSPELHYNLAVSYQHQGSILEAVEQYRLAIEAEINEVRRSHKSVSSSHITFERRYEHARKLLVHVVIRAFTQQRVTRTDCTHTKKRPRE